jgi:hypothetical protein
MGNPISKTQFCSFLRPAQIAIVALIGVLALLLAPGVVYAGTITVGSSGANHTTLQAAINAAQPGDTIVVRGESFTISTTILINKSLTIRGGYNTSFTAVGSTPTTLIGSGALAHQAPVVFIGQGSSVACDGFAASGVTLPVPPAGFQITLEGFEIRQGSRGLLVCPPIQSAVSLLGLKVTENYTGTAGVPVSGTAGAGIYAYLNNSSSLVISNTQIVSNTAESGGGLFVVNSDSGIVNKQAPSLLLHRLTISDNVGIWGGGTVISMTNAADVRLVDVVVTANQAAEDGGISLYTANNSQLALTRLSLTANNATSSRGAGTIYLQNRVTADWEALEVRANRSLNGISGLWVDSNNQIRILADRIVAADNEGDRSALSFNLTNNAVLSVTELLSVTNNLAHNTDPNISAEERPAGLWVRERSASKLDVGHFYSAGNLCAACDGAAGVFFVRFGSSIELMQTTALSNTSYFSPTIFQGGRGGAIYTIIDDASRFFMGGGYMAYNLATTWDVSQIDGGQGGALYNRNGGDGRQIEIYNVTFYSNTAHNAGGAVYNGSTSEGRVVYEDNRFIKNYAGTGGGDSINRATCVKNATTVLILTATFLKKTSQVGAGGAFTPTMNLAREESMAR